VRSNFPKLFISCVGRITVFLMQTYFAAQQNTIPLYGGTGK
jgi:hypothetical protein